MSAAINLKEYLEAEVREYLRQEDRIIPYFLARFEETTGFDRKHVVYALLGALSIYLILGHGAELVCNFIYYAYPAYASFQALETEDKEDDTQWLTYWTVFATVSLIDFASDKIMGYFPIYWLVKCVFMLWLYLPFFRGAEYLYQNHFGPFFRRLKEILDRRDAEAPVPEEDQAPQDEPQEVNQDQDQEAADQQGSTSPVVAKNNEEA